MKQLIADLLLLAIKLKVDTNINKNACKKVFVDNSGHYF